MGGRAPGFSLGPDPDSELCLPGPFQQRGEVPGAGIYNWWFGSLSAWLVLGAWLGMAALFQTGLRLLPGGAQSFWLMTLKSLWLGWAGHAPCVFPTGTESSRQSPRVAASPQPLS